MGNIAQTIYDWYHMFSVAVHVESLNNIFQNNIILLNLTIAPFCPIRFPGSWMVISLMIGYWNEIPF